MKKALASLALLLLAGCGGGDDPTPTKKFVSFYGDSITYNRTRDVAAGAFDTQDFSVWGASSYASIDPKDYSQATVIRFGMADSIRGIPPEQTMQNVASLVNKVWALGRMPVVVNVSKADDGRERAYNEALRPLTNVDISDIEGKTVDGIHPDEAYHAKMNERIRAYILGL